MPSNNISKVGHPFKKFAIFASLTVAALVVATPRAFATTTTLDLSSVPQGPFSSLSISGYQLTYIGYGDTQSVQNVGGTYALVDSDPTNGSGAEITISRTDGGVFSLISADIAALNGDNGYRVDLGGTSYYSGFSSSFVPYTGMYATNVTGVDLNIVDGGSGFAVANIVLDSPAAVTPEPASLTLAGTGLAFLAGKLRRRRK